MKNNLSTIEFICLSIILGGLLFFLDVWLSNVYEQSHRIKQLPPDPNGFQHTREEKAILCTGWPTCMKLAEAVTYEARSEPLEGRRLVAQVIMNRVHHKSWPNTVEDVIHQRKQFSYLQDKHKQRTPTQKDWTEARATAYNVLHGLVPDESQGATHYTEKNVQRSWMKNLELIGVVGQHKFFRGAN